jgi:hypothetical protein
MQKLVINAAVVDSTTSSTFLELCATFFRLFLATVGTQYAHLLESIPGQEADTSDDVFKQQHHSWPREQRILRSFGRIIGQEALVTQLERFHSARSLQDGHLRTQNNKTTQIRQSARITKPHTQNTQNIRGNARSAKTHTQQKH